MPFLIAAKKMREKRGPARGWGSALSKNTVFAKWAAPSSAVITCYWFY